MKQKEYLLELTNDGDLVAVIDLREVAYVLKRDQNAAIVSFKNREHDLLFDKNAFDFIAKAFIEYNSYKESAE